MNQYNFDQIIEKITEKLRDSDDETIAEFYNQLFETPIYPIGDDTWEEEIEEEY
jgi:hypothetical protein